MERVMYGRQQGGGGQQRGGGGGGQQYDNEKRGALFPNENKRSENSPDMSGSITIEGVEYWLSGWHKTSKGGMEFISIAIGDEKQQQGGGGGRQRQQPQGQGRGNFQGRGRGR